MIVSQSLSHSNIHSLTNAIYKYDRTAISCRRTAPTSVSKVYHRPISFVEAEKMMAIRLMLLQVWIIAARGAWGVAAGAEGQPEDSSSSLSSSGGLERDWEGWMKGASDNTLDGAQFKEWAWPLMQMSANAYRYATLSPLVPIPGWSLSDRVPPLRPAPGGAHALLYSRRPSPGPAAAAAARRPAAVVAFRGTQLSTSLDSSVDLCACKHLWDGFPLSSLPPECSAFDLDYYSQALNYTLQVIHAHPSTTILLTGHSMGVGLAILVAASLSPSHVLPVIGFGAPATRKPLLDRSLPIPNNIVVIGHPWDIVMRTQMDGQVGLLCYYPQNTSYYCEACVSSFNQDMAFVVSNEKNDNKIEGSSKRMVLDGLAKWQGKFGGFYPEGDCFECFFGIHFFESFITIVEQGQRPLCKQATHDKVLR